MDDSLPLAKQALRAQLRAVRREHVAALPAAMRALVFMRPPAPVASRLAQGAVIGLYHAAPAEAPTGGYARWLHENGYTLALPWFADRAAPMEFRRWADPYIDELLEPGPFGALQPLADAEPAFPQAAFVPLLGFTAEGQRLGQGGGHYDRWLAANPEVLTIGLGWDEQRLDNLPAEDHDRPLALIVTPTRLYEPTA